jgi:hypothetical protein
MQAHSLAELLRMADALGTGGEGLAAGSRL